MWDLPYLLRLRHGQPSWIKQKSLHWSMEKPIGTSHQSLLDAQSHGTVRIYGLADAWAAMAGGANSCHHVYKVSPRSPGPHSPARVGSALAMAQAGALHYSHFGADTHCQSAALTLDLPIENMQLKQHSGASN